MSTTTKAKPLISYHGDVAIKNKYIARMQAHMDADELVQGVGFEQNGITRGCAVGCTLDKYDHKAYETELGVPRILAKLEDRIFEGLSVEDSKGFPIAFLRAIPVGKSLDQVWRKLFIWMLVDAEDGVIKYAKTDSGKKAIQDVADLLTKSLTHKITADQYREVREAAWKARRAAYADGDAAAYAAAYADAAAAYAAYAAYAAAYAAAAAAYADAAAAADAYAAYAAYADAAAAADAYAAYAARRKYYKKMADKLIELLAAA